MQPTPDFRELPWNRGRHLKMQEKEFSTLGDELNKSFHFKVFLREAGKLLAKLLTEGGWWQPTILNERQKRSLTSWRALRGDSREHI
jgi:hypothetical protein